MGKGSRANWIVDLDETDIRFYIDEQTNEPHIHSHEVTEGEVLDLLLNRTDFPSEDRPGRDDTRVAIGQTNAGRYLRVIYVPDADRRGLFVITAYEIEGKPLKAFKKQRKKKP